MKSNLLTHTLALVAVVALLLTGCTQFPDGPSISFKSASKQLTGSWIIVEATIGNDDALSAFQGETFTFEAEGIFNRLEKEFLVSVPPFTQSYTTSLTGIGEWQLLADDTQIDLVYQFRYLDPYNSSVTYVQEVAETWTIDRLTQDELWVSQDRLQLKLERQP